MKTAESRYLARLAQLDCVLCGDTPVEIHHLRLGQGMAQRAQHWLTMPLCPDCHRGPRGVHGDKQRLYAQKVDELDLLARAIEALYAGVK
jgi:hypothetical protein